MAPRSTTRTRLYPIDAQSVAQGIQTLSIAARHDDSYATTAWAYSGSARVACSDEDGLPIFQRRRLWTNRAQHVRWVVAPMLLALTHLLALDRRPNAHREPERVAA